MGEVAHIKSTHQVAPQEEKRSTGQQNNNSTTNHKRAQYPETTIVQDTASQSMAHRGKKVSMAC